MEKFSLITFGCRVNQYEGNKVKQEFLRMGLEETDDYDEASVCLINTCSVTARADQKTRRLVSKIHSHNPEVLIIVTGCFGTAQADKKELEEMEGVKFVVSNYDKMDIPHLYAQHQGRSYPRQKIPFTPETHDRTRAYVKIQDGCNLMCTFCKIPYVRNKITSVDPEEVVAEVTRYAQSGFKEVILTGIHLGLYGWRKSKESDYFLPNLLWRLSEIEGMERVRLSSIECNEITPELVEVARESSVVCPSFHIPIQSGNNRVLKLMNRKYSREEFLEKICMLRENIKDVGISTDVIYGFPTETDSEFEDTLKCIEEARIHRVHAFPFSPRRRTPAYRLEPKVDPEVKNDRKDRLLALSEEVSRQFRRRFLGQKMRVLIEDNQDCETGHYTGYSDRYIRCHIPGGEKWKGRLVEVVPRELTGDGLLAYRVHSEEESISCPPSSFTI